MASVNVDKHRLREALEDNRKTHRADFVIAWEAYQKKAILELADRLQKAKDAKSPDNIDTYILLQVPEDHTEDYDRAIEMLFWELNDSVTLTDHEFQNFIQDKWRWKEQFVQSNTFYTGSASPSKKGF